jgi:hypothetical protein
VQTKKVQKKGGWAGRRFLAPENAGIADIFNARISNPAARSPSPP